MRAKQADLTTEGLAQNGHRKGLDRSEIDDEAVGGDPRAVSLDDLPVRPWTFEPQREKNDVGVTKELGCIAGLRQHNGTIGFRRIDGGAPHPLDIYRQAMSIRRRSEIVE